MSLKDKILFCVFVAAIVGVGFSAMSAYTLPPLPPVAAFQQQPIPVEVISGTVTLSGGDIGVAQDSVTSGQNGVLMQCATKTTPPTYTNARTNPCWWSSTGAMMVDASLTPATGQLASANSDSVVFSTENEALFQTLSDSVSDPGCTSIADLATNAAGGFEKQVAAAPATLIHVAAANVGADAAWIRFYNLTAANADENDTPVAVYLIPSNGVTGAGNNPSTILGINFDIAMTYRVTKGIAFNSTTILDSSTVVVSVCYELQ